MASNEEKTSTKNPKFMNAMTMVLLELYKQP